MSWLNPSLQSSFPFQFPFQFSSMEDQSRGVPSPRPHPPQRQQNKKATSQHNPATVRASKGAKKHKNIQQRVFASGYPPDY
jgi:hypothetical protein